MPDTAVSLIADTLRTHGYNGEDVGSRGFEHCACGWSAPDFTAHVAAAVVDALGGLTRRYTWSWPGNLTITGEPGYGFEVGSPEEARAEADPYMAIVGRWVSGWVREPAEEGKR